MGVAWKTVTITQTAVAKEAVGRYERRVEQKRIEEERIKRKEQLKREAEQRAAREEREQEIIAEYGSLKAYHRQQQYRRHLDNWGYFWLFWAGVIAACFLSVVLD